MHDTSQSTAVCPALSSEVAPSCLTRFCTVRLQFAVLRHVSAAVVVEGSHLRPALPTQRSDTRLHAHIHIRPRRLCSGRAGADRTAGLRVLPRIHTAVGRCVDVQNRLRRHGNQLCTPSDTLRSV